MAPGTFAMDALLNELNEVKAASHSRGMVVSYIIKGEKVHVNELWRP